jgi:hypothetical protein
MRNALRIITFAAAVLACLAVSMPATATDTGGSSQLFCFQGFVADENYKYPFEQLHVASTATGGSLVYTVKIGLGYGRVDQVYYGDYVNVCGERGTGINKDSVTLNKPNHFVVKMDKSQAPPQAGTGQSQPPAAGTGTTTPPGQTGGKDDTIRTTVKPGCVCMKYLDGPEAEAKLAMLRTFRDNFLKRTQIGNDFIYCYYYVISPAVVSLVERVEVLKQVVRWMCIEPAAALVIASSGVWNN